MGLTEKQRRFADEYLIDLNATRAYMAAYPATKKESTAAVCAAKLLRNAKVMELLREKRQEQQERVHLTQDEVLRGIREIAFCGEEKAKDRLRALELLGKHLGLFDQRKDELDREEQQARIEKLRRDTRAAEEDGEGGVIVMPAMAERPEPPESEQP